MLFFGYYASHTNPQREQEHNMNYQIFASSTKRTDRHNIAVIAAASPEAAIAHCAILLGYDNAQEYLADHAADVRIFAEITDAAARHFA
jgi:hypothetical protein